MERDPGAETVSAASEPPNGPPTSMSITEKALSVTAAANRLRDSEKDRTETERVMKRIGELQRVLDNLSDAVTTARQLAALSGTPIDLSPANKGQDKFSRVATARPPDAVFNRARDNVTAAAKQIKSVSSDEWARWTRARLAELPLQRILMLPEEQRAAARGQERQLRSLATQQTPSSADITQFQTTYGSLAEAIESEPDPPQDVLDLLHRLTDGVPIRLSEVRDDQLARLRSSGIADQIELRRGRS
jgi:hypothetical protein